MPSSVKQPLISAISRIAGLLAKTKLGSYVFDQVLKSAMETRKKITHQNIELTFSTPNRLSLFRVDSFSTKEPETLEWIDGFKTGSVFFDIGANVGLYSCYAAKSRNCSVFAFEPSVFNLELLARNIFLNDLTGCLTIVPVPLSAGLMLSTLNMTSTEWGGALSTFGKDYGWDGRKIQQVFQFRTLGLSGDEAVRLLKLPQPNYIKIDVDGIEHLILLGARETLSRVDGVLIEVNDGFHEQAEQCNKLLLEAGLVLKEKRHSEMFGCAESFGGGKVWNQVWIRSQAK